MGVAQTWKKSALIILASPYTPPQCGEKVQQTILASLYTPPSPYGQCPYGNNTFQKGASLTDNDKI